MKKQIICLMVLFVIGMVSAISTPHAFYGEVYYSDGVLIEEGLEIRTEINENDETSTLVNGEYDLVVESDSGGLVYFYIEGLTEPIGTREFESFAITELDFTTLLSNPNFEEDDDTGGGGSSGGGSSGGGSSGGGSSPINNIYDEEYPQRVFEKNNLVQDLETQKISSGITGSAIGVSDFNKILGIGSIGLILVLLITLIIIKSRKH